MNKLQKLTSAPKLVYLLVIIIFVIGFFGWRTVFGQSSNQPQYQTAKAEMGTLVSSVSASGKVVTANFVSVTTGASGMVKKVYVKDGDSVVAGQTVAEISLDPSGLQKNSQAWASYLSSKNSLDNSFVSLNTLNSQMWAAQQKFTKDAVARGLATDDPTYIQQNSDWLAAESKYKNQQAAIDQSRASLNSSWLSYQTTSPIITTPISGTISNIGLVEGMVVGSSGSTTSDQNSSQRVAIIQNSASPIISINLSEIDIPKIKVGQKATVTIDSIPGKTFTGQVKTVDRIGITTSNVTSYQSNIQLDTPVSEIMPNMAANANIIIDTRSSALLVPQAAVQAQGDQYFVRALRDGREQQIPVQIGISSDTQTEIISGISEGDEVITGTLTNTSTQQRGSGSVFGGSGFGGGTLRTGGSGGIQMRR